MIDSSAFGLGIVRSIGYGLFRPPDPFGAAARSLGARLIRAYVWWGQVEPEPGRFDWSVVDTILGEAGDAELWITVCSSSTWATRTPTSFLPPSPANDPAYYVRFISELVAHCRGRVDYWQCNNEPSNTGALWSGTSEEYAAQAVVFATAVRAADPLARIVLGGCGYDALSSHPDGEPRKFFDVVLDRAKDAFDLFAVHLYDDPRRIPEHIATVRSMMRRHGCERPVVVGEFNGPSLFEFDEADAALQQAFAEALSSSPAPDPARLTEVSDETPDRRAMALLYSRMETLPDQLKMFMDGCPDNLAGKRDRLNVRQIVTRALLAMSCGVERAVCWNLAPEIPHYRDPLNMMGLLSAKYALLDYDENDRLTRWHPAAYTFRLLADLLRDSTAVERESGTDDRLCVIRIERAAAAPVLVMWREADTFTGDTLPPAPARRRWGSAATFAVDASGRPRPVTVTNGWLETPVGVDALMVSADRLPTPAGSVPRHG